MWSRTLIVLVVVLAFLVADSEAQSGGSKKQMYSLEDILKLAQMAGVAGPLENLLKTISTEIPQTSTTITSAVQTNSETTVSPQTVQRSHPERKRTLNRRRQRLRPGMEPQTSARSRYRYSQGQPRRPHNLPPVRRYRRPRVSTDPSYSTEKRQISMRQRPSRKSEMMGSSNVLDPSVSESESSSTLATPGQAKASTSTTTAPLLESTDVVSTFTSASESGTRKEIPTSRISRYKTQTRNKSSNIQNILSQRLNMFSSRLNSDVHKSVNNDMKQPSVSTSNTGVNEGRSEVATESVTVDSTSSKMLYTPEITTSEISATLLDSTPHPPMQQLQKEKTNPLHTSKSHNPQVQKGNMPDINDVFRSLKQDLTMSDFLSLLNTNFGIPQEEARALIPDPPPEQDPISTTPDMPITMIAATTLSTTTVLPTTIQTTKTTTKKTITTAGTTTTTTTTTIANTTILTNENTSKAKLSPTKFKLVNTAPQDRSIKTKSSSKRRLSKKIPSKNKLLKLLRESRRKKTKILTTYRKMGYHLRNKTAVTSTIFPNVPKDSASTQSPPLKHSMDIPAFQSHPSVSIPLPLPENLDTVKQKPADELSIKELLLLLQLKVKTNESTQLSPKAVNRSYEETADTLVNKNQESLTTPSTTITTPLSTEPTRKDTQQNWKATADIKLVKTKNNSEQLLENLRAKIRQTFMAASNSRQIAREKLTVTKAQTTTPTTTTKSKETTTTTTTTTTTITTTTRTRRPKLSEERQRLSSALLRSPYRRKPKPPRPVRVRTFTTTPVPNRIGSVRISSVTSHLVRNNKKLKGTERTTKNRLSGHNDQTNKKDSSHSPPGLNEKTDVIKSTPRPETQTTNMPKLTRGPFAALEHIIQMGESSMAQLVKSLLKSPKKSVSMLLNNNVQGLSQKQSSKPNKQKDVGHTMELSGPANVKLPPQIHISHVSLTTTLDSVGTQSTTEGLTSLSSGNQPKTQPMSNDIGQTGEKQVASTVEYNQGLLPARKQSKLSDLVHGGIDVHTSEAGEADLVSESEPSPTTITEPLPNNDVLQTTSRTEVLTQPQSEPVPEPDPEPQIPVTDQTTNQRKLVQDILQSMMNSNREIPAGNDKKIIHSSPSHVVTTQDHTTNQENLAPPAMNSKQFNGIISLRNLQRSNRLSSHVVPASSAPGRRAKDVYYIITDKHGQGDSARGRRVSSQRSITSITSNKPGIPTVEVSHKPTVDNSDTLDDINPGMNSRSNMTGSRQSDRLPMPSLNRMSGQSSVLVPVSNREGVHSSKGLSQDPSSPNIDIGRPSGIERNFQAVGRTSSRLGGNTDNRNAAYVRHPYPGVFNTMGQHAQGTIQGVHEQQAAMDLATSRALKLDLAQGGETQPNEGTWGPFKETVIALNDLNHSPMRFSHGHMSNNMMRMHPQGIEMSIHPVRPGVVRLVPAGSAQTSGLHGSQTGADFQSPDPSTPDQQSTSRSRNIVVESANPRLYSNPQQQQQQQQTQHFNPPDIPSLSVNSLNGNEQLKGNGQRTVYDPETETFVTRQATSNSQNEQASRQYHQRQQLRQQQHLQQEQHILQQQQQQQMQQQHHELMRRQDMPLHDSFGQTRQITSGHHPLSSVTDHAVANQFYQDQHMGRRRRRRSRSRNNRDNERSIIFIVPGENGSFSSRNGNNAIVPPGFEGIGTSPRAAVSDFPAIRGRSGGPSTPDQMAALFGPMAPRAGSARADSPAPPPISPPAIPPPAIPPPAIPPPAIPPPSVSPPAVPPPAVRPRIFRPSPPQAGPAGSPQQEQQQRQQQQQFRDGPGPGFGQQQEQQLRQQQFGGGGGAGLGQQQEQQQRQQQFGGGGGGFGQQQEQQQRQQQFGGGGAFGQQQEQQQRQQQFGSGNGFQQQQEQQQRQQHFGGGGGSGFGQQQQQQQQQQQFGGNGSGFRQQQRQQQQQQQFGGGGGSNIGSLLEPALTAMITNQIQQQQALRSALTLQAIL